LLTAKAGAENLRTIRKYKHPEGCNPPLSVDRGGEYDEAYDLFVTREQFQKELKKFMAARLRRKMQIQRLVKAGIWKGQ